MSTKRQTVESAGPGHNINTAVEQGYAKRPSGSAKSAVHIDVYMKENSSAAACDVEDKVLEMLQSRTPIYEEGPIDFGDDNYLQVHVDSIAVCDLDGSCTFDDAGVSQLVL